MCNLDDSLAEPDDFLAKTDDFSARLHERATGEVRRQREFGGTKFTSNQGKAGRGRRIKRLVTCQRSTPGVVREHPSL